MTSHLIRNLNLIEQRAVSKNTGTFDPNRILLMYVFFKLCLTNTLSGTCLRKTELQINGKEAGIT